MNTTTLTDLDLVALAQRGEVSAYNELVCRHWAGVVGVVYRMCGEPALAEEAAQEAFVRVWQRLADYQPQHAFRAWVYRIAINAALDALRKDRRLVSLETTEAEQLPARSSSPDPEETVEARQRAEGVQQAILALAPQNRTVLVLREYGGLSYHEIAAALNIPLGTVMSRLNASRGQLRQALTSLMEV